MNGADTTTAFAIIAVIVLMGICLYASIERTFKYHAIQVEQGYGSDDAETQQRP